MFLNARVWAIAKKETLHVIRDTRSLIIALVLPLIFLFIFGYAITLDIDHVKLCVVDYDKTPASRDLVKDITASGYFDLYSAAGTEKAMEKLMDAGWNGNTFRVRKSCRQRRKERDPDND